MLYPSVQLNYIFFTFILVNISNILSTGLNEDSNQFHSATTHYSSGLQVSNTSHILRPLDGGKNQDVNSTANEKVAPRFFGLSGIIDLITRPFQNALRPELLNPSMAHSPPPPPPSIVHLPPLPPSIVHSPPPSPTQPTSPTPSPMSQQPINVILNFPKNDDDDYDYCNICT
uniref:Uncharacterized protein n=1 Tax=Cuerna arida TaxID=1464854 RepID=A0A1B6GHG5_9HEMI